MVASDGETVAERDSVSPTEREPDDGETVIPVTGTTHVPVKVSLNVSLLTMNPPSTTSTTSKLNVPALVGFKDPEIVQSHENSLPDLDPPYVIIDTQLGLPLVVIESTESFHVSESHLYENDLVSFTFIVPKDKVWVYVVIRILL